MSKVYSSQEKRSKNLRYAAVILAVVFAVSAILLFVNIWEKHRNEFAGNDSGTVSTDLEYKGKEYRLREDVQTVLVLGLDKFEMPDVESYNNDKQADFMMLLVVDHGNESVTALHINRDTIAEMNILGVAGDVVGTVEKQIALAHTYGNGKEMSCRNAADAVSGLLMNVEIDHYVSVTMDAVSVYNDFLGGVELTVLDDFSGIDDTLVEGETVTLFGEHALNYVRTRYGLDDSTNSRRMVRQRQYIEALYEKTLATLENDDDFIVKAASKLADYIVSDYTGTGLQTLAEKIMGYQFVEIRELEGRNVRGDEHMEFYPDEDSVKETVISLFYELKEAE
ncbi:MAG: LCP family protein [Clostridia bacterium]|nr:LCP family protein [Clostridia bacterium]